MQVRKHPCNFSETKTEERMGRQRGGQVVNGL